MERRIRDRRGRLGDSELKLRLAVRAAGIGIWDWDILTGQMRYSSRARAICGFAPTEPITVEKVRAITHPQDRPRTSALAREALDPATRARHAYEYRIRRADTGEIRWVLAHGEAIFGDVDGRKTALHYVGTIADITDRIAGERTLKESQLRQRLAIEAARMAVWEYDIPSGELIGSPELNRMFGLPDTAKPTIKDIEALYLPGERERVQEQAQKALSSGDQHFEVEFRCRRPDGNLRWLLLRAEALFSHTGTIDRFVGVVMDIDERKRAEERQNLLLRELNHRVKNSLAVIQAIAGQTFRRGRAEPEALAEFQGRLAALADANDILLSREWTPFSARALIERLTQPYRSGPGRVVVAGDDIMLPARFNVPIALIIHELSTNAAKYGALSSPKGNVTITLSSEEGGFGILWREQGGPPVSTTPTENFGTRLIGKVLAAEIGSVDLRFVESGIVCRILGKT